MSPARAAVAATPAGTAPTSGGGFFTIYKKGQGYWTRMGTAVGAALLGALIAWHILPATSRLLQLGDAAAAAERDRDLHRRRRLRVAVRAVRLAADEQAANVDFLIATDSEMKKVNWTSRKELIGSTKVVIIFMFLIAFILFVLDLLFSTVFYLIARPQHPLVEADLRRRRLMTAHAGRRNCHTANELTASAHHAILHPPSREQQRRPGARGVAAQGQDRGPRDRRRPDPRPHRARPLDEGRQSARATASSTPATSSSSWSSTRTG